MGERENLCHRDARVSTPKINYILDSLLYVNIYIRSKTGALSSKCLETVFTQWMSQKISRVAEVRLIYQSS